MKIARNARKLQNHGFICQNLKLIWTGAEKLQQQAAYFCRIGFYLWVSLVLFRFLFCSYRFVVFVISMSMGTVSLSPMWRRGLWIPGPFGPSFQSPSLSFPQWVYQLLCYKIIHMYTRVYGGFIFHLIFIYNFLITGYFVVLFALLTLFVVTWLLAIWVGLMIDKLSLMSSDT